MRIVLCNAIFISALLWVIGCQKGETLYDVSGSVSFDGKPVPKGLIFFDPDSAKGSTGGQGFASILDGKFTTAEKGKGVRGGAYIVRINGFDGKEGPDAPLGQGLFPEYLESRELPQQNSTLDVTITRSKK